MTAFGLTVGEGEGERERERESPGPGRLDLFLGHTDEGLLEEGIQISCTEAGFTKGLSAVALL
jgi:hypothetical protein